jgi:acyl-homoserine lactone acylase PvdQ
MFIKKLVYLIIVTTLVVAVLAMVGLFYIYKPITSGVLYFDRAHGEAEVLRETDTSIPHIYASNEKMAVYTEGFLHAQERLW